MHPGFPDVKREQYKVDFRLSSGILLITAMYGEIRVQSLDPDENSPVNVIISNFSDDSTEFWLGATYYNYMHDRETVHWTNNDWWAAAHVAQLVGHVPSLGYLRKVAGITKGGQPNSYRDILRAKDIVDFANKCNQDFREGSD
jgi:hypothetical protein